MHLRHILWFVPLIILSACPGGESDSTASGTTADTTSGTTGTGTTGTSTTGTGTTDAPTTTDASTGTSATTTTTTTGSTTDTGGPVCDPTDLQACPVTGCREDWLFECPGCGEFLPHAECFEADALCTYPALGCDLPSPCERVWGMGYDLIEQFEDDAAATCFLTALRDGTPGHFVLLYGEMGDSPLVYMDVYYGGADRALVEYSFECEGCPDSGYFGRTGQLALQPDKYFDDCLAAPDLTARIQCVFGFVDFPPGEPPAADYAPPWTTGECLSLEIACP